MNELEQLAPLIEGHGAVIFNGDTTELRHERNRAAGLEILARLTGLCQRLGTEPFFVTGNHDPVNGNRHYATLGQGQILMTHGDVLFPSVTPWSRRAPQMEEIYEQEMTRLSAQSHLSEMEARCRAVRATNAVWEKRPERHASMRFGKIGALIQDLWPPVRPFTILKVWADTPGLAARLAEKMNPSPQVVLLGHTHRAGIWRSRGRTIINTGSFIPLSGRLAVRARRNQIEVHELHRGKDNAYRLGRQIRVVPLVTGDLDLPVGRLLQE